MGIVGKCIHCDTVTEIPPVKEITLNNGHKAHMGVCPACGKIVLGKIKPRPKGGNL